MVKINHYKLQFKLASLLSLVFFLTACMSSPPSSPSSNSGTANAGRYAMEDDVPLLEPIDLQAIPEVVPQSVERTMAGNMSPYRVNGKSYRVLDTENGYKESGMASWYGRKFHGHLTSNGEIYDMFKFSAAHKSLPIPSFARVTNLDNGKSIVVRVNDRGPFHDDRIIDLSYAAASWLDYADVGTARVSVEALMPGEEPFEILAANDSLPALDQEDVATERRLIEANEGLEYLQVGAFSNLDSAENVLDALVALTQLPVFIRSEINNNSNNMLHRVRLGPLNETIELDSLIRTIRDAGLGSPFRVRQ